MAYLYWIHLPTHTDITTQGYVGVTSKTPEERWVTHKKAFRSKKRNGCEVLKNAYIKYKELLVTPILIGEEDYCYIMEGALRPSRYIGWNISMGGFASPMSGKKYTDEEKRQLSITRTGNPNYKRVISEAQKAALSKAQRKFYIITPEGKFTIQEAITRYGVSKYTIYKRSKGMCKNYKNWGRESV